MMQLELDSLVAFDDAKPLVRALADSGHARVMLVCLRAGQFVRDHRSGSQVIAHFLKGRAIFYDDGVPQDAAAGSLVLLEPNRFHRIRPARGTRAPSSTGSSRGPARDPEPGRAGDHGSGQLVTGPGRSWLLLLRPTIPSPTLL